MFVARRLLGLLGRGIWLIRPFRFAKFLVHAAVFYIAVEVLRYSGRLGEMADHDWRGTSGDVATVLMVYAGGAMVMSVVGTFGRRPAQQGDDEATVNGDVEIEDTEDE